MASTKPELDDDDLKLWNAAPARRVPLPPPPADSTTSEDEASEAESEDSAAARARAAEARLRDHNEPAAPPAPAVALPSAAAAFGAVAGPPAFLNPEATQQLPEMQRAAAAAGGAEEAPAPRQRQHGDISRLAPKLPKSDREREEEGVLQSGAKRQKGEGGLAVDLATAAAMLGGGEAKRDRGKATAAQGVEDFLAQGGALPRKRQERKEREKEKRGRGQSAHSEWKSEAEMALRQQYD